MVMKHRSRVSERVAKYRATLRASGFRPVQIWVPDVRSPGFAAECRRQSMLLHGDRAEAETLEWVETVTDTDGWS